MNKELARLGALLGALAIGSCASIRADSDYYTQADFSDYRSYTWIGDLPFIVPAGYEGAVSPLNQRRIKEAVESELAVKGFALAEDPASADFAVSITVGTRDRTSVDAYPVRYRSNWDYGRDWRWNSFRFYFGPQVDTQEYTEGILSIDIFDQATNQPVWHGWAQKRITNSDLVNAGEQIQAAVKAILSDFPPPDTTR